VRRVAFATLGCKLNQYETELLREAFEAGAYEAVPFDADADVYVINTCTVTQRADRQSRQLVRRAARRANGSTVVVTGCYAELEPRIISAIPGVSAVVPNSRKLAVPRLIESGFDERQNRLAGGIWPSSRRLTRFANHTRAFVKIQEGCDSSCAYCVIPRARGTASSRPSDQIVEEISGLTASGYGEIVLTGISIGRYRAPDGKDLSGLVRTILDRTGLRRIRISSVEPTDVTESLVALIAEEERVCPHLHLPLQSGDDQILCRMKRPYRCELYRQVVARLVARVPDIAIGADVIVGFPGEGESEFSATYAFIDELPLAYLHVFPFSPRPGTPAASLDGQTSPQTRRERADSLRQLGRVKTRQFRERFLGRAFRGLVESRRDRKTNLLIGLSGNYLKIRFDGPDELGGTFQRVRITSLDADGRVFGTRV